MVNHIGKAPQDDALLVVRSSLVDSSVSLGYTLIG
jgi:hypothetical protein